MNPRNLVVLGAVAALAGAAASRTRIFSPAPARAQTFVQAHSQAEFDSLSASMNPRDAATPSALNALGHAWDNKAAKLFWFTDLNEAKAQAAREGKPILSLRLLGNLSDEYSCANSRFFRAALYPDARVNTVLHDKFVLHWSSERPVPVVTVDFGDGRKLKRTLTGNSAHYLLDAGGQPLDVLPGLYGPGAFAKWLQTSLELQRDVAAQPAEKRDAFLADYHRAAIGNAYATFDFAYRGGRAADAKRREAFVTQAIAQNPLRQPVAGGVAASLFPEARFAGRMAIAKLAVENPILDATALYSLPAARPAFIETFWMPGADAHLADCRLDANSRALMRAQSPLLQTQAELSATSNAVANAPRFINAPQFAQQIALPRTAAGKSKTLSDPFEAMIDNFERSLAIDTTRNEMRLHLPIHALFAQNGVSSFESLNRMVYDRLFLTPATDPWLGLATRGVYTGLRNGGLDDPNIEKP